MCPVADNDATFKLFRDKGDFFFCHCDIQSI